MPTMTQSGLLFEPNTNGKSYLSINYHRDGTADKSQWRITRELEHAIFCESDENDWNDNDGHYWGHHDSGHTELGTKGERICHFPLPTNLTDAWHGYPVSLNSEPLKRSQDRTRKFIRVVQMFEDD